MKKTLLVMAALFSAALAFGQKPSLDHSVYDGWKSLSGVQIPYDGQWLFYVVSPQEGDGELHIENLVKGTSYIVERGSASQISKDGTTAIFKIAPMFQQSRQAKIDKKKDDDVPRDTLGIMNLATGSIEKYPFFKAFKTGTELQDYIAFQSSRKDSKDLYVLNIKTLAIDTIENVANYAVNHAGTEVAYFTEVAKKDTVSTERGVYTYNFADKSVKTLYTAPKESYIDNIGYQIDDRFGYFFANPSKDKNASKKPSAYTFDGNSSRVIVSADNKDIPAGYAISSKRALSLSNDGSQIYFGITRILPEKDTTIPDFERAKLDIWTWNEDYLQTVQKYNVNRERERSYMWSVAADGTGRLNRFEDDTLQSVSIRETITQEYILERSNKPYRIQSQWDAEPMFDIYRVKVADGSRQMIMQGAPIRMYGSSPDGRYYIYYHIHEREFHIYDIELGVDRNITEGIDAIFYNFETDTPSTPQPTSGPQWSADSKFFLLADFYDVWKFDPTGARKPENITKGIGKETDTQYRVARINSTLGVDRKVASYINEKNPIYLSLYNRTTKMKGYAMLEMGKKGVKMQKLIEGPYAFASFGISTAAKKPCYVYTKGNYETGANLWKTNDSFKSENQITDINPQQRDYNWGTVELVSWTTNSGKIAEGLLFKPENFNPEKKYPVMVYFYEKNSQELYAVRNPAPSRSVVNIPYFVSNEYVVFVPDICYEIGHPGKSAMDYIMSGCDMLLQYPWIDGDHMAIQGQSWGGYQVAYMITQTGRFAAAGAGAPVSNMTSAYGGIRWGSGVTRQFQYEQQQSRIGTDLWNGFDLYVENSPLFFVPNVTTPVLIMHNDNDGAVPWWQGIEFFTALRRCGKVAWMLQYNDEEHNLAQRRNAKDLSVRLSDFFDHYLKGKPMPDWMKYGLPATDNIK